jgi:hypothetical protein
MPTPAPPASAFPPIHPLPTSSRSPWRRATCGSSRVASPRREPKTAAPRAATGQPLPGRRREGGMGAGGSVKPAMGWCRVSAPTDDGDDFVPRASARHRTQRTLKNSEGPAPCDTVRVLASMPSAGAWCSADRVGVRERGHLITRPRAERRDDVGKCVDEQAPAHHRAGRARRGDGHVDDGGRSWSDQNRIE